MKFNKYSVIYRNDDLEFTDSESVVGKVKDIKTYIRYELASQCMSDLSFEELVYNGKDILYLLEDIEEAGVDENKKAVLYFNPMGNLVMTLVETVEYKVVIYDLKTQLENYEYFENEKDSIDYAKSVKDKNTSVAVYKITVDEDFKNENIEEVYSDE